MLLKFEIIQEDIDYLIAHRENGCHGGLGRVEKVLAEKESRAANRINAILMQKRCWERKQIDYKELLTLKSSDSGSDSNDDDKPMQNKQILTLLITPSWQL